MIGGQRQLHAARLLYFAPMRNTNRCISAGLFACLLAALVATARGPLAAQAQQPAPAPAPAPAAPQGAQHRRSASASISITTDVIVRDNRDQFIADLKPGEFEVYEDGVKQNIASLVLMHGGRVYNVQAPPPAPVQEGIILPRNRPTNDTAGRVFLLFIDDLHLDFRETPRTRDLLKRMLQEPDSRRRHVRHRHHGHVVDLGAAHLRPAGARVGDQPRHRRRAASRRRSSRAMQGSQGPTELRHRAHVAFSTAYDLMKNLEKLQNRRKAVHLHQQRLRLQSVRAGRGSRSMAQADARRERQRPAERSVLPHSSRASRCWPNPISSASWPS